jgi:hypothetical protein
MRRLALSLLVILSLAVSADTASAGDKLRVGFPSLATALSPSWVAVKKAFWKKHDLDVELILLSGAVIIPTLLSGTWMWSSAQTLRRSCPTCAEVTISASA